LKLNIVDVELKKGAGGGGGGRGPNAQLNFGKKFLTKGDLILKKITKPK